MSQPMTQDEIDESDATLEVAIDNLRTFSTTVRGDRQVRAISLVAQLNQLRRPEVIRELDAERLATARAA